MKAGRDLDDRLLWLVKAAVIASGAALAIGLILYLVVGDQPLSRRALALGLLLLMIVPVLRIATATAERIRRRDWYFLTATALVVIELAITMILAARRV